MKNANRFTSGLGRHHSTVYRLTLFILLCMHTHILLTLSIYSRTHSLILLFFYYPKKYPPQCIYTKMLMLRKIYCWLNICFGTRCTRLSTIFILHITIIVCNKQQFVSEIERMFYYLFEHKWTSEVIIQIKIYYWQIISINIQNNEKIFVKVLEVVVWLYLNDTTNNLILVRDKYLLWCRHIDKFIKNK